MLVREKGKCKELGSERRVDVGDWGKKVRCRELGRERKGRFEV